MLLHRYLYSTTAIILLVASLLALPVITASAQTNIQTPQAREEIVVTSWGSLQITQTYKFVSVGNTSVPSTTILLPKGAYDIAAKDDMGSISSKVTDIEKGKNVTVTFRYPLRGRIEEVIYNDAYTFSLQYTLPSSIYLTQSEFASFHLKFNASTGIDFPITQYTVAVTLPEGSTFSSSVPTAQVRTIDLSPVITYGPTSLKPKEETHIALNYRFIPLWIAFRPALWIGIIAAIGSVAILLRRRFRGKEVQPETTDTRLLRDFANALDEELILWEDSEQLEQGLFNSNLGRKDYNRRRRVLDERSRSLSASLTRLRQEVRQLSPQHARIVERVETAEREMTTLRNNLSRLRAQFRAGRLSRSAFESQEEILKRQAGNIRATIGPIIIELRGEPS